MKRALSFALSLSLVAACSEQKAGQPVVTVNLQEEDGEEIVPVLPDSPIASADEAGVQSACKAGRFEGVSLTHCLAHPALHTIDAVYSSDSASAPFGTLASFAGSVDASGIAFAMNGGAFSDDLTPRGYLVTSGERVAELNRGSGEGNFYLSPNGVFFGSGGKWQVFTTNRFFLTVRDRPQFGTQSGPMLLINGVLSDAISENGNSRTIRNAVGVDSEGKAHFVISNAPISYGQLARFMRDELSVRDALFLDSNSSSLWDPATGRMDDGRTGPILVVSKKAAP